MSLILTLTQTPPQRLDMSSILPLSLAGLNSEQIRALPLHLGRDAVPLGELFRVEGEPGESLVIRTDSDRLDRLGQGMQGGELLIEGPAGHHLGCGQSGGRIHLRGNAGDFAGSGMRDGELLVEGDAGHWLGAATPGDTQGQRGGLIRVTGNAGHRAGERMRRGWLLIQGDAGDALGQNMIAGSIVIGGSTGAHPGMGMRRGSLLLQRPPQTIDSTFNDNCVQRLAVFGLIRGELARLGWLPEAWQRDELVFRRYLGDQACAGRGEILCPP